MLKRGRFPLCITRDWAICVLRGLTLMLKCGWEKKKDLEIFLFSVNCNKNVLKRLNLFEGHDVVGHKRLRES